MNKPLKKFRAGALSVTIWENIAQKDGQPVVFNSVSFDRSFKDKEGNWQKTNSLRSSDLPKAAMIINKAYEYLICKEVGDQAA